MASRRGRITLTQRTSAPRIGRQWVRLPSIKVAYRDTPYDQANTLADHCHIHFTGHPCMCALSKFAHDDR